MANVNLMIMVGRLGSDPELKAVSGSQVCNFSIATNEVWNDKDGNKQERVEWTNVVAWGKLGENCAKYLKKGREVFVKGRKRTRSWDDKDTNKKMYAVDLVADEVTFLGGKDGADDGGPPPDRGGGSNSSDTY